MTDLRTRARSAAGDRNTVAVAVLLVLALIYPLIVDSLLSLPVIGDFVPKTDSMVVMIVFTTMAIGLNMVVGYAGLLDLGYVAFYAVGAYTAGWFASQQFDQTSLELGAVGLPAGFPDGVPGIHISMWLVLPVAGLLTLLAGIVIGLPTLRLRGDYLAIVTLGFGEIVPQFVRNADSIGGFDLTHGTFGISPIDSLGFGAIGRALGLPESFRQSSDRSQWYFWTAVVILLITVFCSVRLRDSRLGRAWVAIREDETAAAAMGIPLMRTKTWAYAIGAFFGGVAGAFYASFKGGAFPADFYFNISVFLLCMVILGGMGSVWGVHPRRHDPRLPQRRGPRHDRLQDPAVGDPQARRVRPDEVPVRDLRDHHRADDAVPADGADPGAPAQDRDGRGRPRHAVLRRATRGNAHRPGSLG